MEFRWQVGRTNGSRKLAAETPQPRLAAQAGGGTSQPAKAELKPVKGEAKAAKGEMKPKSAATAKSAAESRTKQKRPIVPRGEPREATPIALPPAAKPGQRVRFIMIPLGTTPLATIDDMRDGKLTEVTTQMAIAYQSGGDLSLELSQVSEQPQGLDLAAGKYYCVTTFVRKEKDQLPGPILYAAQPLPEGKLADVKLLGQAVGDYKIHIGPRKGEKLWVFEGTVAK
jgi:hypothetical protein